ncbi:hypothetical protein [Companilactobacillus keshanensis]|uniref:Membrane protein 6-pyruvoyl-tetrahydropterin synthase-related domain-containing protein n=1 Tax=Companilactobacillus keshanensis TaxID=2486003 RepID=A0ABW4BV55_9LACO|nr:hypothetical protein [Companilactobacillus keshanensis]
MNKLIKKNYFVLLLFVLISVVLVALIDWHVGYIFATGDYHYHLDRIETLASSIEHFDFWPKVDGHFIGGYGYASSLFYPDVFLYLPALLRVVGVSPVVTYLFTLVLINFATLWIGYIAGKRLSFSTQRALLFTLIYALNPYRLQTLYSRQDLGELLGMIFFPLVLSELINFKNGYFRQWYVLAIAMIGIGFSHTISLFMMIIFAVLYVLLNIKSFWNKKKIIALIKAAGLTISATAMIYLPILEQMRGQKYALTTDPLINITNQVFPIKNLVGNSLINSVFHGDSVNIGTVIFVSLLVYSIYNFINRKNVDLTVIALIMFFSCTNIFPWKFLSHSIFAIIQFPWRFFSIISLIVAYLLVNDDLHLFDRKYFSYALIGMIALLTLGLSQQTVAESKDRLDSYSDFNTIDSYYIGAGHEYLPSQVDYYNIRHHKDRTIDYKRADISIQNAIINRQYIAFNFDTHGKSANIQLPLIYYKGYQSEIYGSGNSTVPRISTSGLVEIKLTGSGMVKVQYEHTLIQKIGLFISGVTALLVLFKFLVKRRHEYISVGDTVPVFVVPSEYDYIFVYKIVEGLEGIETE